MKRKVIELIDSLNDGGAETLVKEYALKINKDEFDIYIVIIRVTFETANYKVLCENGIKIIPLYTHWNFIIRVFNKLFGQKYMRYRLRKVIKDIQPDVIHAHLGIVRLLADVKECL